MKTKNLTPFPFGTKVTSRRPPRPELTAVVRSCHVIVPGQPLALPEGLPAIAQGPMTADTYRDDDDERTGECLYPGDFADWKPRAEVMLRGTCHTPEGKPLTECPVRFAVGGFSKILRVTGRRLWSDDGPGAAMSRPIPFARMPIDYAHAFGGPGYARNPVGIGFAGRELPNIEHAGSVIRSRRDDPGPAGFGPVNPAWPERAGRVGKEYGRKWQKERAPYHSEDFDWRYFLAAPPDQQIEGYLRGDEALLFQNLHPTAQVLETRLPGLRIRVFIKDKRQRFREIAMSLDTLFADLDQGKLYLTWRGLDAIETDDQTDVLWALVASEKLSDTPLPEAHYRARLEAFEADPLEIKERVPADLLAQFEEMKERQKARDEGRPVAHHDAPPADPMTAVLRKQLDLLPVALPNAKELEKQVADAVARATATSPPGVDMKAQIAQMAAANDKQLVATPRHAAFPLRPGGPPPPFAARALRGALEQADDAKKRLAEQPSSRERADEIAKLDEMILAMKGEPFFKAMLDRPAPREPGPGEDLHEQDYEGRDLRGANLRGANLRDAHLARANLAGADLRGAILDGAVLTDADLTGADLTGADLTLANLTGVIGPGAVLRNTTLNRAFLQEADLRNAVLAGAKGEFTFLPEVDLTGADCRGLSLFRAFSRAGVLDGADLSEASLVRCLFLEISAKKAVFHRARLTQTTFLRSSLQRAVLTSARGERTVWLESSLHDANFGNAILPQAHMMEVSAAGASFRRSFLKESRCYRASFERVDFTESQLFGVDFSKCTLTGARFNGAMMYDAKLLGAAGKGCDFTGANLSHARIDET